MAKYVVSERRREKILSVVNRRQSDLTVVLENIHDPHNVSAILRSADAVGILGVQLMYWNEKFPKLGKKSSASASKWIRTRKFSSVAECYDTLRQEGFLIAATHMGKESSSLYDLDFNKKIAVVFGNEHRGVSDEAAGLADVNFLIPMAGMIQSLNVSVACAVTLYEAYRQRQGGPGNHSLSAGESDALLKEWITK
jgi:tRNA (guanosine-2'-O-)-methyltransferase